jgi:Tol biopolymer transport system component/DNA-binding winged helix-turn-helix (wHTH) protein
LEDPSIIEFGPFSLDERERMLRRHGQPVPLTPKAVDVLMALVERPGRLMTKDELVQRVWPDTFVEEANLAYNVFTLRKALGDTADNPEYVETIPKRGYRFKAPVRRLNGNRDSSGGETGGLDQGSRSPAILPFPEQPTHRFEGTAVLRPAPDHVAGEASSTDAQGEGPSSSISRRWLLAVAAAVLVGGWSVTWRWWRASPDADAPRAVPLTSVQGVVHSPSLSPDGNYVAFTWSGPNRDNFDIYVQQIGAGSPHRLTHDPANDHSPSWSPDGRTIAFLRRGPAGPQREVWRIAPLGGMERKVAEIQPRLGSFRPSSLAWCPDSTCVLVTDSPGLDQADAVFAIAIDTGEKRQLTRPHGLVRDADAAISPDGRHLIFRRDTSPFSGRFFRVSLAAGFLPDGEPVPLTEMLSAGKAVWTPDGREILFGSRGALWRLNATGGAPVRLSFVGQDGLSPVLARTADRRQRLVYVRSVTDVNVWRISRPAAGVSASSPAVAVASTRADAIASVSPDARHLTFLSNRSGDPQIWVARHDGTDAFQLTSLAFRSTPGFPRWSPDGKLIAFHGDPDGRPEVFVVPAAGGRPRMLVKDAAYPTFSRDGQWIYVSTPRENGELRICKMPARGGDLVQVTKNTGTLAIESYDGDLYYVDGTDRPGSLWRLPAAGGPAVKIVSGVILGSFDVAEGGVYYIDRVSGEASGFSTDRPGGETRLQYFDFSTRQSTTVAVNLGTVGFGLSATRDGREVFYSRVDSSLDELIVVDDFR